MKTDSIYALFLENVKNSFQEIIKRLCLLMSPSFLESRPNSLWSCDQSERSSDPTERRTQNRSEPETDMFCQTEIIKEYLQTGISMYTIRNF